MRRTAGVGLWTASVCAAFIIGAAVGRTKRLEAPHRQRAPRPNVGRADPKEISALFTNLKNFTQVLTTRNRESYELEAELADLRTKLPPLSPKEKEWRKEWAERHMRFKRYVEEGALALYEGQHELQKKIHQRRDRVLREQGLEELAVLMESSDPADMLRGLRIFGGINFEAIGEDKGRYELQLLGALTHDDPEVRKTALEYLAGICSKEESFELALNMLDDASPEVRLSAKRRLLYSSGAERNEHVAAALTDLLRDGDKDVRRGAVWHVSQLGRDGYDYGDEMEDILIEVSRDGDSVGEVLSLWRDQETLSEKVTERVVEILNAPYDEENMKVLLKAPKCEALRPHAIQAYMRILRECLDLGTRQQAVLELRWLRDRSVIPRLEEMASTPDAEGIERELKETIESLRRHAK